MVNDRGVLPIKCILYYSISILLHGLQDKIQNPLFLLFVDFDSFRYSFSYNYYTLFCFSPDIFFETHILFSFKHTFFFSSYINFLVFTNNLLMNKAYTCCPSK